MPGPGWPAWALTAELPGPGWMAGFAWLAVWDALGPVLGLRWPSAEPAWLAKAGKSYVLSGLVWFNEWLA